MDKFSTLWFCKIEDSDISMFMKVVPTLDALEEAVTYLGGEKHITASSVLPFLVNFNTFLETNENDCLFLSTFKSPLKTDLMEHCGKHLNFKFIIRASYFDKWYSKLSFVDKMGFMELEDDDVLNKETILEEIKF